MRVLVTGGLGFLGRAVTKGLLDGGHQPVVLSHSTAATSVGDAPIVHGDLRDPAALQKTITPLDIDRVCHLAALTSARDSRLDPVGYFETNVAGTANLLR